MSIKKKLTLITLMVVSVFCLVFGAVACNGSAKQAVEMYLLPQAQTLVSEDFSLPKKIGKDDSVTVEWKSSNTDAISIEDAGDKYTAKVTLQDQVTDVTLTISAGGASKDFVVRVDELSVYTFLDRYEFPQMNTAQKSDFDLDTEMTVQGKKATIAWSVDSQYAEFIAVNEAGNKVLVSPVEDIKSVKIKATFHYGKDDASQDYPFSVAPPLEHRQLVNRMYSVAGYPIDFSGYIVHVYEASESYGNATFYAIDDDFCSGYYFYRVKIDTSKIDKFVAGAHVTVSNDTTKNYNGLWENNSGGTATVDDKTPIDPREKVYALDTDLLAGAPSLLWRESTFVSLSGWKVASKPENKPTGADSNLLTLQRGDTKITIRVSKYIQRTDDELTALLNVYDSVNVGDYVNVTGILGCYNTAGGFDVSKFQLQPILASDITKVTAEGTNTDGAKVKAAIAKVDEAVQKNFGGIVTADKEVTMPTSEGDVTISYRVAGENLQDPTVTIVDGKISVKPVTTEKNYDIEVTYSIGDYKAYGFFKIHNWKKSNAELVETVKAALGKLELETVTVAGEVTFPTLEETYGADITWELGENPPTWITEEGGTITVTALPDEETPVTVVANITLGEAKGSVELTLTVAAAPTEVFKALEEPTAGTYKLAMDKNGTMLYFSGAMDDYYYGTVTDVASAADVVLAGSTTDGWTLKTGNKFLEIEYAKGNDNNYHANVKLNDAQIAGKTWKWDTTNKVFTWTADVDGTPTEYFLGTDSTKNYTTISANKINNISTYCVAKLGNMSGAQPQPSDAYFEITPSNFNGTLAGLTTSDLAENTEHPEEFTIKPNGYIKTNSFGHRIAKVVTEVFGSYDNMKMYAATSTDASKEVKSVVEKPEDLREIITYTFEGGTDDFYFVNSSTYSVQMYSIKIYYEGSGGGTVDPEPAEHVHNYTYTYDTETGWQHKGHCDVAGCNQADITVACTPVLNVCSGCDHTFTQDEILTKLFASQADSTMSGTYSLTGKVLRIDTPYDNTQYYNVTFTIKVGDKEIQCYHEKSTYSAKVKPGDTVTVQGTLKHYYNGTKEFDGGCQITNLKAGELTDEEKVSEVKRWLTLPDAVDNVITLPELPDWADGVVLSWKADNTAAAQVSEADHKVTLVPQSEITNVKITATISCNSAAAQTKEFKVSVPAQAVAGQVTISKTMDEIANANNWTAKTVQYSSFKLDDKVTVSTITKSGNTGKYYPGSSSALGSWRLYSTENATLTISVPAEYTLLSIKIAFSEGAFSDGIESGIAKSVSDNTITFTATKKTFVTEIEVVYAPVAAGPTADDGFHFDKGVSNLIGTWSSEDGYKIVVTETTFLFTDPEGQKCTYTVTETASGALYTHSILWQGKTYKLDTPTPNKLVFLDGQTESYTFTKEGGGTVSFPESLRGTYTCVDVESEDGIEAEDVAPLTITESGITWDGEATDFEGNIEQMLSFTINGEQYMAMYQMGMLMIQDSEGNRYTFMNTSGGAGGGVGGLL